MSKIQFNFTWRTWHNAFRQSIRQSFQFQGSFWLLDSSVENYCSNTLGCLFQPLGNALPSYSQLFWSFWEKKREKPRSWRALPEYQAQESNDCMLISHDEKLQGSSQDFLNFLLTITQAKMRPTPITIFGANKQLSKIIQRSILEEYLVVVVSFCPSYFLFMHIPIIINVPRTVRKAAGLSTTWVHLCIVSLLQHTTPLQGCCSENLALPDVLTDKTLSLSLPFSFTFPQTPKKKIRKSIITRKTGGLKSRVQGLWTVVQGQQILNPQSGFSNCCRQSWTATHINEGILSNKWCGSRSNLSWAR